MNSKIEQATAGMAGIKSFGSLVELARYRASEGQDAVGYVYLQDGETPSEQLSYVDLDCRARAIAATLQTGCAPGDRVLLLYPPGLEFLCGFFACLYAGCPAVPAYPPRRNRHDSRLEAIAQDATPALVLTTDDIVDTCRQDAESREDLYSLPWIASNRIATTDAQKWQQYDPAPESIAFIQYTSGSTSQPKGVCVSHFNLLHNFEDMHRGCDHDRDSVMVTWLPIHHDLGLIYGALQPLYRGFPCYMMPPASFLQRPLRWLEAIGRFRGTHSAAPNFAFDLCVRAIDVDEVSRLDLSSMRMVLNAAEPIRAETIDRFSAHFAPARFSPTAISGGYGLAEATLKVSMVPAALETPVWSFSAEALERNRVVVSEDPHGSRRLVGCGRTEQDTEYSIVNPQTRLKCAPDEIGEIWVRGLTVPTGYHNRPEETGKTFNARLADSTTGPYLRTGDLGFVYRDNLFITGRLKDMIIVRGINHYPHDIELTVEKACPELRGGCGAAFPVDFDGQERLVVVHELDRRYLRTPNADQIMMRIKETVAREHGIPVHCVVLLRTNTIAKTTSGKIQRQACRKLFLEKKLSVVATLGQVGDGGHGAPRRKAGGGAESQRLRTMLLDSVAFHLNMAATAIDPEEPLAHYGLDSATAIALAGEIERIFGRPCSPTVLFECPTIAALQDHLLGLTDTSAAGDVAGLRDPLPVAGDSAIAVVGMACRFPGAESVEAFWTLLESGRAATGDIPEGRWNGDLSPDAEDSPELQSARRGGFLENIDQFDAGFFGIAPREADSMDPQQRLLLEVSWEALENGGIRPSTLRGTDSGVFIGISAHDYLQLQLEDIGTISAYTGTGGAHCIAANRLSYFLDLHGPSLAIDTACSSSLVAIHQAMASLRRGECGLTLAGGVNALLTPYVTVGLAKAKMMSPDGCCKVFDAGANGYVRGEGCGVVVLKRLAEAVADGNRILAVLRGSAVRQDGRSNGLTAPNRAAQESVILAALRDANLPPAAVDYVEAHGTGTALGDPIEVAALRNVYNEGRRPDNICRIGSVKANIGHLESAAGMAGLIKTILALNHATIPGNIRLQTQNPLIELDGTPMVISPVAEPWQKSNGPRTAGVSSFGFGGTIAHTIVAEFDGARPLSGAAASWQLCVLSARSVPALHESADRLVRHIRTVSGLSLAEICSTLALGRDHFAYRQAIVARSIHELLLKLEEPRQTKAEAAASRPGSPGKVVFLFSGQGSQDEGAVGKLLHTQPVFRAAIEECDAILNKELNISASALLEKAPAGPGPGKPTHVQPVLFAIQYGLARLWRSWGITPAAVVGHSLGEYGAACIAGVMALEDALKLVACRARLAEALPVWGAMAAIFAERSAVERLLESSGCEIAAFNGAGHLVVAGSETGIDALLPVLAAAGLRAVRLPVSHGFHSPCVEPMLDEFEEYARRATFREPRIEMFSTLTGAPVTKEIATSGYWRRHLRQPVRFQEAMTCALSEPGTIFIEIGTSATLIGMARRFTAARDATWIPTLRPSVDGEQSLLESLAELYSLGHRIDWEGFYRDRSSHKVALPTYPFQRRRHWIAPAGARRGPVRVDADHPLLGNRLRLAQADGCLVWENSLGAADVSYLKDHAVNGLVVFPGAAFTEMTASAARAAGLAGPIDMTNLEFSSPLVFAGDERQRIQTVIQRKGDALECAIYSSTVDAGPDDGWRLHMRGIVRDAEYSGRMVTIADVERSCPAAETGADFYRRWNLRGNQWGPSFQSIERLRIGEGESAAWLQAGSEVAGELGSYVIHPALLDSCVQTMAAGAGGDGAFVGKSVGRLHIAGPLSGELIAAARWAAHGSRMLVGDLTVTDPSGRPLLMAEDLTFTFLDKDEGESWQQWLYTEEWEPVDLPAPPGPVAFATWLVVGRQSESAESCAARLRDLGHSVNRLDAGGSSMSIDPAEQVKGIVCFVSHGADQASPEEMVQAIVDRMTAAARTVRLTSTIPACRNARIWFVTQDVWPVNDGGAPPPSAPLWGLCSAIAAEHPANWGGMIDIEEGTDPARSAKLLVKAITRLTRCDKVRIGREITAPRLQTMKCPRVEDAPPIRADGAYLVTGGFGELGSGVALWLGAHGARHIVLIGRSGVAKSDQSPLQQLQDAGVQVTAVALDIGDSKAVQQWAESYQQEGNVPVRGIFHAAGVVTKEAIAGISEEAALPVVKAKAGGIMALEQALDLRAMDFVVLFSSAATILNSPFLGAYAAANAFLDSYAWHRSLAGYPVTSIDWSTFAGGGMAALAEQAGDATFSRTLRPLQIDDGMRILGRLLGCPAARVAVLPMAWEEWRRAYPAQAELAYWDHVPAGAARQKHEDVTLPGREELLALPREERQARIAYGLSRLVAHTLGAEPDGVDCRTPLTALGIDSLMALEIRARLEKAYGLTLPVVAIISGPSVEGLAQSLGEFLDNAPGTTPAAETIRPGNPSATGHFPLSFNQYSQWLLASMAPEVCAYHVSFSARVYSRLDTGALHRCLEKLVQRHATLRTTYTVYQGEIGQEVHATAAVPLFETDAGGWSDDELIRGAREAYAQPFDLAAGPLFRCHLFTRGPADRVLLLVVHHIACDGWSLWLLLEELGLLYGAETGGATALLPEITASYIDHTTRQRERWAKAAELAAGRQFWSRQLADFPLMLELATDFPRPATESLSGASHPIHIPPPVTCRLKNMARELNTTMFTLLMAAFQLLLHRITDQERILVGSPTAGRTESDTGRTVGHFVNMVVIRGDLAGNPTWRDFVEAMRRTIIDTLEHQDFPFHLLVEHLQPQRTPGRSPIFQVDFTYQRAHTHAELIDFMGGTGGETRIRWGETELAPFVVPQQEGQFDLSLEMAEGEHALFGFLKYNSDLFRPETVADLCRSFCAIIESVCAAPEMRTGEIPLLDGQQLQSIGQWARSTARAVPDLCLHQLFAAQAALIPEERAVVCGDHSLTYRQLDERSAAIARHLQELGVGPDSIVGVCLDRSPELIASILGVLRAGGAYLPLEPSHPASRREAMLADSGAAVLIGADGPVLLAAPMSRCESKETVRPANLAYVIYTSGSTGAPKGVMIEHRSVTNLLAGLQEAIYCRYPGRQQVSLFASTVFDASVQQIFAALCTGHTLHVLTEECRRDSGRLIEYWRQTGVTIADATPTLLGMLLDAGLAEAEGLSLNHLIVGGEPLSRETVRRLRAGGVGRGIGLTNIYGPTECCVDVTAMDLSAGDLPDLTVMPIGRPMVNVQAYILDRNGLPVVPGRPGELYIGGPCVGRGYLHRDDLTAERFVANPFEAGTRLYRTGDRARFLPDGEIAFLGRLDDQVKIRGFRIEPGEIEHRLRCCPRVRDVAVVAREDIPGDRRLVAYLAMDGGPAGLEEIREPLIAELPDYMIPSSFVVLPSMPLNSSGKVDRGALPAPTAGPVAPGASSAQPQTVFEREVAAIWKEVVGLQEVGIHDNFFDLGGNSLLLARVQIRLQDLLGRPVPMTALFRFPTIYALAEFCAEDERATPSADGEEGGSRRRRGRAAGLGTARRSFRKTIVKEEE